MLDFKGSLGQARVLCLNKNCAQSSCVAVVHLSALLEWRNLECKTLLFFLHLHRKQVPSHYQLHPSDPIPTFSLSAIALSLAMLYLAWWPGHLNSWMSSYLRAWDGWEERLTIHVPPKPWSWCFQMYFSECLLGDRKLNTADQGPSDNKVTTVLTTHADLEIIKWQNDSWSWTFLFHLWTAKSFLGMLSHRKITRFQWIIF